LPRSDALFSNDFEDLFKSCYVNVMCMTYSDQLLVVKSHVDNLKGMLSQLSELDNLFHSLRTGETWCVGTAMTDVASRLNSALLLFDALEVSEESLLISDDLICDENTKQVDEKCRELRESIMLVIQTLYKTREMSCTEDQQTESPEGNMDNMHGYD